MQMIEREKGGCACGQFRYEIVEGECLASMICFCRNCQLSGGTESAPVFSVNADSITLTGKTAARDYLSDRGTHIHSYFCPDCGSRVYGLCDEMPSIVIIRAGTLDDVEVFAPQCYIFTENAPSWVSLRKDIPSFVAMPPLPEQVVQR